LLIAAALASCGSDGGESDGASTGPCSTCEKATYGCGVPGAESYNVTFTSAAAGECLGKREYAGFSNDARLKCDFSQFCEAANCYVAARTDSGFTYEIPANAGQPARTASCSLHN
jgi:hypothetical protein